MEISNFGKRDLIPVIIWIILSLLVIVGSYKLGLGTFRNPGPGMFPFLLGTALIFVSLPVLIYSLWDFKSWRKKEVSMWEEIVLWKMGVIVLVLLAYGMILERMGFLITTFLCLFFLYKIVGSERFRKALILASLTVIFSYLLFEIALKVYMPSFPWKDFVSIFFK